MQSSAYLLVSHGSRDPRPQAAMDQLAALIQPKIQAPIATACLECSPQPLHQQIQEFSQRAIAQGIHHIQLVPLFLLSGVHVMQDVPAQVELAHLHLPDVTIAISPHLGAHPQIKALLANRLASISANACILLSHGSRRSQGNQSVEDLVAQLGLVSAYWSVAPRLEARLQELSQQGHQKIAILPYFLFSGGITDAIAQSVQQLSRQFPHLQLNLTAPLEVSEELANLVRVICQA